MMEGKSKFRQCVDYAINLCLGDGFGYHNNATVQFAVIGQSKQVVSEQLTGILDIGDSSKIEHAGVSASAAISTNLTKIHP